MYNRDRIHYILALLTPCGSVLTVQGMQINMTHLGGTVLVWLVIIKANVGLEVHWHPCVLQFIFCIIKERVDHFPVQSFIEWILHLGERMEGEGEGAE